MTAVLHDDAVVATSTARLAAVPYLAPTAMPTSPTSTFPKRPDFDIDLPVGDPLVTGAARLLCVPLRQLYAALWRAGVIDVRG